MSTADYSDLREILDAASEAGITLRSLGGLAIRQHCEEIDFCERDYADIDLVGLSTQSTGIVNLMIRLGYKEARSTTFATGGTRLLFQKPKSPLHVDVFLDQLNIEHAIDLRNRLNIEQETISVTDLLLTKLTITRINEKDLRDVVTLLKDLNFGDEDKPGTINWRYIASLCAKRWGLYTDVIVTVDRLLNLVENYGLSEQARSLVKARLMKIRNKILSTPKSRRWKARALIGKRLPWRREVEAETVAKTSLTTELNKRNSLKSVED